MSGDLTRPATESTVNRVLSPDRPWVRILRLLMGLFALAAVGYNTYQSATGAGDSTVVQLFSMFTIQSNLVFAAVLIIGALVARARLPHWWDHLRGALAFYLVMTGIVYALLVAPASEVWSWDITWTNLALHRLAPWFAFLDWVLVTMWVRARLWRVLAWVAYPAAFLAYTWIRGAIVHWYPYSFLDPRPPSNWNTVLVVTGIVLIAFLVMSLVLHLLGNLRVRLAERAALPENRAGSLTR
ncbi:Pr6Pr family membrane protein [Enemella sp. A6]|uniref:Pr6Pr family membrane protein n=1 Tax=Enemella sp. A6 TaxID=3440152 RepID=UPI003EC06C53